MPRPRDRQLRRELELRQAKDTYDRLRRSYERDRQDVQWAWEELSKRLHDAIGGMLRSSDPGIHYQGKALAALVSGMRLLRAKRERRPHLMQYVGQRALESVDVSPWTYWRGKKIGLAHGWFHRYEEGGGRLKIASGGGKGADGRWIGKADGLLPGPEVTGWDAERYRYLQVQPPPRPRVYDVDPEDTGAQSIGQEFTSNLAHLISISKLRLRPAT